MEEELTLSLRLSELYLFFWFILASSVPAFHYPTLVSFCRTFKFSLRKFKDLIDEHLKPGVWLDNQLTGNKSIPEDWDGITSVSKKYLDSCSTSKNDLIGRRITCVLHSFKLMSRQRSLSVWISALWSDSQSQCFWERVCESFCRPALGNFLVN